MMQLMEFFLAFFATIGIFTLVWLLFGHLLLPIPAAKGLRIIVPLEGDAAMLEQTLRQLLWLRSGKLLRFELILLDRGLNETGLARVSLLLASEPCMELISPAQLAYFLEKDG